MNSDQKEKSMSNKSTPITPEYGDNEFFRILDNIPVEESPDAQQFRMSHDNEPVYSEMTLSEDSGYITNSIQLAPANWHKVYSPSHCATDSIDAISPKMFPPTPPSKASRGSLRVRVDLFPDKGEWDDKWISSSPISSSTRPPPRNRDKYRQPIHDTSRATSTSDVLYDRAQHIKAPEQDIIIISDSLNIAQHSVDNQRYEMDWWNDGYNDELNAHMDVFEGRGEESYNEFNELFLKKI